MIKEIWSYFNPLEQGRAGIKRLLYLLLIVAVVYASASFIMQTVGLLMVGLFAVGIMVSSSTPRWVLLWWQYRLFLIEVAFAGGLTWIIGNSLAWGATQFLLTSTATVSVFKIINLHHKKEHGITLYERWCKNPNLARWMSSEHEVLREDYQFDHSKTGWLDLKFLWWHMTHPKSTIDFFQHLAALEAYDPEPVKKWWMRKYTFLRRHAAWGVRQAEKAKAESIAEKTSRLQLLQGQLSTVKILSPQWSDLLRAIEDLHRQIERMQS